MKNRSEITLELYKFTREFFITFSVLYGVIKCLDWEIPTLLLFLTSLLISLTVRFTNDYKMKKAIFIIPVTLLVIILVLEVFFHINTFLFFRKAFFWNYEYFYGIGDFNLSYSMVTVCILSVVIMEILFFVEKSMISEFVITLVLFLFIMLCGTYNMQWNPFIIGIMLLCCFDIIVEIYQVKAGGTERYSERYLLPFIGAAVLLAVCMPSNKEPIKWMWVNYAVNGIKDNVQDFVYNLEWRGNEYKNEFNVNRAGFSDEGTSSFGKLIDEKERNMFSISTRNGIKVGYLNGVVRSTYTGSEWEKEENNYGDYTEEHKMDLYEKLYNLYYSDLKQSPNEYFASSIDYQIRFDKLETKTIFRPENCFSIYDYVNKINIETIGNNVYFTEKQTKGYCYYVSALVMNMGDKNLKKYLKSLNENEAYYEVVKNGKGDLKDSLFEKSINGLNLRDDQITYITSDDFRQCLLERSKKIKEEYLQVPKETPERVHKLAEEITKDCTNKYDKAEAICRYLKDNYTYTTNISQLPKGKDAVDYLLFEQKSGYCSYFASAMSIMCRYVDIPARYVEGAAINYEEEEEWYSVKTGDSHAWTEIYLEGFGWIRMDATPGYSDNKINWAINGEEGQELSDETDDLSYAKLQASTQENEIQTRENSYSVISWLKYLLAGAALLLLFVLLGIGIFIWNQKRMYKKSNNRQKILICIKKILLNLEKQGYELKQGETLKEFKERLENDETWHNSEMLKLLEWFQNVRYSKKNVTEDEVIWVEHFLLTNKPWN